MPEYKPTTEDQIFYPLISCIMPTPGRPQYVPVRAGIVDNEVAYIYSSARDYNGAKGLIKLEGF